MLVFLVPCALLLLLAHFSKDASLRRVALAFVANAALCSGYVALIGNHNPWLWFMLVDIGTAYIILRHPAGKMQALIGVLYLALIGFHAGYAINYARFGYVYETAWNYWLSRTIVAYAQMGLIALWGAYDLAIAAGWFGVRAVRARPRADGG